jgi:tetratricopeptide (TPR) repeat protein
MCVMVGGQADAYAMSPATRPAALLTHQVTQTRLLGARSSDSRSAQAFNARGLAKLQRGDYRGALADFNRAIRLDPHFAVAYYNRGLVHQHLRDYRGAADDYTQALRLHPGDAASYYNRGLSRFYLKDYRGAIADDTRAIQLVRC